MKHNSELVLNFVRRPSPFGGIYAIKQYDEFQSHVVIPMEGDFRGIKKREYKLNLISTKNENN